MKTPWGIAPVLVVAAFICLLAPSASALDYPGPDPGEAVVQVGRSVASLGKDVSLLSWNLI